MSRASRLSRAMLFVLALTLPVSVTLAKRSVKEFQASLTVLNLEGCPVELLDDTKMGPPAIMEQTYKRDLGMIENWTASGKGVHKGGDDPGWLLWAFVRNRSERKVTEAQLRWVFHDESGKPFGESVQVVDLGRGLKAGKRIDDHVLLGDLPLGTKSVTVEVFLVKFDDGTGWDRTQSLAVSTPK